jgi:hypothetical protein
LWRESDGHLRGKPTAAGLRLAASLNNVEVSPQSPPARALPDLPSNNFSTEAPPGTNSGVSADAKQVPADNKKQSSTVLAGADSGFWRDLRSELDGLLTRQRALLERDTRDEWLKARCRFFKEDGAFGRCRLEGGLDGNFISEFKEIATRGAVALGCPWNVDHAEFWLYRLSQDLLAAPDRLIRKEFTGDETVGCIQGLLESSVGYCSRLAAKAEREASAARFGATEQFKGTERPEDGTTPDETMQSKPEPTTLSKSKVPAEIARDQAVPPASDVTTAPLVETFDFDTEAGRINAIAVYVQGWADCSEASLARTATVDPADLSKWKKGLLPEESDKKARIEKALKKNDPPTPAAGRNSKT